MYLMKQRKLIGDCNIFHQMAYDMHKYHFLLPSLITFRLCELYSHKTMIIAPEPNNYMSMHCNDEVTVQESMQNILLSTLEAQSNLRPTKL